MALRAPPDADETKTAPALASAGGPGAHATEPSSGGGALGPGASVARYVVLARLGAGGMGEVYKAYDPHLDRAVALKVIRRGGTGQNERMVREARALAQLSHPNVIAVHDVGMVNGSVYLAMEFVPGPTLRHWLAAGARPGADGVLRALLQAGEGLAAAHRAGIAHRDFKGSNVLVGDDGRVRVIDFGLARTVVVPDASTPAGGVRAPPPSGADAGGPGRPGLGAEAPLTRGDQIVGTLRYMAPEQQLGGAVSVAADQFAFCVVLWEALAGEHPFGDGGAERLERALLGDVRVGPGAARMPRRTRRALERGLRPEPAARWPSMGALLAELRRGPAARRRAVGGALAAAALVAAAFAGATVAAGRGGAPEPCTGGEARLAGVWDARVAAAVEGAFERSGWLGWRDGFSHVKAALDAHAARWVAAQHEACRATRVTGAGSEEQFGRRMACLERRLAETRAAAGLLAGADRELATRAFQVVGALGDVGACLGSEADAGGRPRPSDPAVRTQVDALDAELERAGVLREAGRVPEARGVLERAAVEARGLGHGPTLAETLVRLGEARALDGDGAGALGVIDEALVFAGRSADDKVWAEGLLARAEVLAGPLARARDALELRPVVLGAVERAGATPRLLGRMHLQLERTYDELGQYGEALAHAREALRIAEGSSGPGSWAAAVALRRLASVERIAGATADARRDALDALRRVERLLGTEHPGLFDVLLDAASAERSAGNAQASEAMIRRALALYEAALPDHPHLSNGYRRLGASLYTQGRFAEAEAALGRAAALAQRATPPDAMVLADIYAWLGYAVQELRGVEAARAHYGRARDAYRAGGRADDPFLGELLALWAEAECKAKHEALATALFDEARPTLAPRDDNWSAKLLIAEAECFVASRRASKAVAPASAAVAKLARLSDADDTADARFVLARALWQTGRRGRAATEARRALALIDGSASKRAEEYRAWLAVHPAR